MMGGPNNGTCLVCHYTGEAGGYTPTGYSSGRDATAEVFLDPECRNIYDVFCALYRVGGGRVPSRAEVVAKLSNEGGAIDRAARLLLQDPVSGEGTLQDSLGALMYRWLGQRQTDLMRQIKHAQQQGDQELLGRLLEEKESLTRRRHPGMMGRYW